MSKQVLDVQQMQHLQELGLDTSNASMLYCEPYDEEPFLVESKHRFDKEENAIVLGIRDSVIYCKKVTPVYTLQDVLDMLPKNIYCKYIGWAKLEIQGYSEVKWVSGYKCIDTCGRYISYKDGEELIDEAYKLLCWTVEQGYIKINKNEEYYANMRLTIERKIGEIFEYNSEWYQCLEGDTCAECGLRNKICSRDTNIFPFKTCASTFRTDGKSVIFKKLEKVGGTFYRRWCYEGNNKLMQRYKIYTTPLITIDKQKMFYNLTDDLLEIEVKQNKEDMEEKKLNLKPFDLEAAKTGKPVCTRDGRKVRIICFDVKKDICPIIALIEDNGMEIAYHFDKEGKNAYNKSELDLMMLPEKKEGWINIYRDSDGNNITKDDNVYSSKEAAIASAKMISDDTYVATVKIEWEV